MGKENIPKDKISKDSIKDNISTETSQVRVTEASQSQEVHKERHSSAHRVHPSMNKTPWKGLTFLFGGLFFLTLIAMLVFTTRNAGMSEEEIGTYVADYINANLLQGKATAKVESVQKEGGVYLLKLDVGGQKFESYATKDGKLLFPQAIKLDGTEDAETAGTDSTPAATSTVPTADNPRVELFVMSHCPYGTQIEKGMLPVVRTLGDAIDFEVKFVYYAMHGEKELTEQVNQYCIQKEYSQKFPDYLECFLAAGDTSACLSQVGLSVENLQSCKDETENTYHIMQTFQDASHSGWIGNFPPFPIYSEENTKYGVQGSPTLVINGVSAKTGRDSVSLLSAVCDSFTTKPAACSTDLSSYGSPAPGFGFTPGSAGATAAANCVV